MSNTVLILLCLTFSFSCKEEKIPLQSFQFSTTDLSQNYIIPKPLFVEAGGDAFALDKFTVINEQSKNKNFTPLLSGYLTKQVGIEIKDFKNKVEGKSRVIVLIDSLIDAKSDEAYILDIKKDTLHIYSTSSVGFYRAFTTLRQLIPSTSIDTLADRPLWPIPTGIIKDIPNFEYRGTMLDVARHFFTVEEVKKYIDHLSYYKINKLHLHLSDDQGWRIEIKSWPKLSEVGSKNEVGGGKGGFYTQEEYTDIVEYAAERHITIIPEIDMPGHTNAASFSYPFLNGNGKELKPYTGMRVGFSTFDTRKDSVYIFIEDVVREISALTPGPYFHIGGDESHVTKKDDYIYFVERVEKIVKKHGKIMMGWDEVATADIDSNSVAQFWRSEDNAKLALEKNMKIIMSPGPKAYLDMKYDENSEFGLTWAGMIPVDTAYNWNPNEYLKDFPSEMILGLEAPLWSETISNLDELEYLAFPRILAYAELGWSTPMNRNWEDFKRRLIAHQKYFDANSINFYRSSKIEWSD